VAPADTSRPPLLYGLARRDKDSGLFRRKTGSLDIDNTASVKRLEDDIGLGFRRPVQSEFDTDWIHLSMDWFGLGGMTVTPFSLSNQLQHT